MSMRPYPTPRRGRSSAEGRLSPRVVLFLLLGLGVGIGFVSLRGRRSGQQDPASSLTGALALPGQKLAARTSGAAQSAYRGLFSGFALDQENVRLRAEVARLREANETLTAQAGQVERLKKLVGFVGTRQDPPKVAEVVAWLPSPLSETITVAAGQRQGIAANQAVRTDTGLVGRVVEVGAISARVRLLTDTDSRVSAKVVRDGKVVGQGVLQGQGRDRPILLSNLKPESDVKPGDQVVTFGDGGVFPPDIPIGSVGVVELSRSRIEKLARVEMSAPAPGDLHEVMLLSLPLSDPALAPTPSRAARTRR